jgi:hypothetical protein
LLLIREELRMRPLEGKMPVTRDAQTRRKIMETETIHQRSWVMKFSGSDRFSVEKVAADEPNWRFYKIEEREHDRLLRTFFGRITQTQAAKPRAEEEIARWCDINSDKLPGDSRMVAIDLKGCS